MGGMFQPSTTQVSSSGLPEEFRGYAGSTADFLRGRLGQTGPTWAGQFTAPMSGQEEAGLGGLEGLYANTLQSGMQPAALAGIGRTLGGEYMPGQNPYLGGIYMPSVDAYGRFLTGGAPGAANEQATRTLRGDYLGGANPYLENIERGLSRNFQDALGEAQNRLALAGHGGSSTAGATLGARAVEDYLSNVGRLRFGAYESERGRQAGMAQPYSAMGLQAPMDISRLGLQGYLPERGIQADLYQTGLQHPASMAQMMLQAGALPRSLAQQEIDRAYQEMQRLWNESYRAAGMGEGMMRTSDTESTEYGPSPFMSLISGVLPFFMPKP